MWGKRSFIEMLADRYQEWWSSLILLPVKALQKGFLLLETRKRVKILFFLSVTFLWPVCSSVGRLVNWLISLSVCHNNLQGREVALPCSNWSTCVNKNTDQTVTYVGDGSYRVVTFLEDSSMDMRPKKACWCGSCCRCDKPLYENG